MENKGSEKNLARNKCSSPRYCWSTSSYRVIYSVHARVLPGLDSSRASPLWLLGTHNLRELGKKVHGNWSSVSNIHTTTLTPSIFLQRAGYPNFFAHSKENQSQWSPTPYVYRPRNALLVTITPDFQVGWWFLISRLSVFWNIEKSYPQGQEGREAGEGNAEGRNYLHASFVIGLRQLTISGL